MQTSAIIFDLDGTLVDSERLGLDPLTPEQREALKPPPPVLPPGNSA